MGAKTALLAFTDGDLRAALLAATPAGRDGTEALVRRVHPGYDVATLDDGDLLEETYPEDDLTYATVLDGAELLCDRRLVFDRPSDLPEHLVKAGAGRRIIMHGMHSVVDWFCFAVWEDGQLVRSLSLSPRDGVIEDIGERYAFEVPYWAGDHGPIETIVPEDGPYPFPFHPLDLGEEALREFFGFTIEGREEDGDVDPEEVHLHGFQVTDPTGAEQAAREAAYAEARRQLGPPRIFQMAPDGTMHEVDPDSL